MPANVDDHSYRPLPRNQGRLASSKLNLNEKLYLLPPSPPSPCAGTPARNNVEIYIKVYSALFTYSYQ